MQKVSVGLLGCGTVGGGVIQLIHKNADYLAERIGAPLEIARVLVRDSEKQRVPELDRARITTDPEAVLGDPSIDVFVEVMGGEDPAKSYVERAIDSGRSVVTANKMLLALHGPSLVGRAVSRGVDLAFEGSVGGGIPVVRVLRESLASDSIAELRGIVNGTCNYILTRMDQDKRTFAEALAEAQEGGYAEADPTLDVDGHDAAHKLCVLAMLAFGASVNHEDVPTEGIRGIARVDHENARRFGYAIKHLAIGRDRGASVELRVHPALVPRDATLANVGGVLNAIELEGRALGPCLLSGRGAGDMPTAVSVVADVLDVARAKRSGAAGLSTKGIHLAKRPIASLADVESRFYLRFSVYDKPGVLARITGALGDAKVSIHEMMQDGRSDGAGGPVQVVMLTHEAREGDLREAMKVIENPGCLSAPPIVIRVVR